MPRKTTKFQTGTSKSIAQLKSEIKSDLIDYYNEMKSSINNFSHTIISNIDSFISKEKNKTINKDSLVKKESYRKLIVKLDQELTKCIQDTCDQNIKDLSNYQTKNLTETKQSIKSNALSKFCYYVAKEDLIKNMRFMQPLGLLICSDWYFTYNEESIIK